MLKVIALFSVLFVSSCATVKPTLGGIYDCSQKTISMQVADAFTDVTTCLANNPSMSGIAGCIAVTVGKRVGKDVIACTVAEVVSNAKARSASTGGNSQLSVDIAQRGDDFMKHEGIVITNQ